MGVGYGPPPFVQRVMGFSGTKVDSKKRIGCLINFTGGLSRPTWCWIIYAVCDLVLTRIT